MMTLTTMQVAIASIMENVTVIYASFKIKSSAINYVSPYVYFTARDINHACIFSKSNKMTNFFEYMVPAWMR